MSRFLRLTSTWTGTAYLAWDAAPLLLPPTRPTPFRLLPTHALVILSLLRPTRAEAEHDGYELDESLVLVGHLLEMLDEVRDLALTVAPQVHLVGRLGKATRTAREPPGQGRCFSAPAFPTTMLPTNVGWEDTLC